MWKKIILMMVIIAVVATIALDGAGSLYANGDKVRGDISEGPSYQLGECPFTG